MRVAWIRPVGQIVTGNGFGYTSASTALARAFERAGGILDDDADVAVHFTPPPDFIPSEGRRNVLVTMYEHLPPPPGLFARPSLADLVVVPSRFCRAMFRAGVSRRVPVRVVPLGYDPDVFFAPDERRPWSLADWRPGDRPFRWLWVGAPNARKGWDRLVTAWAWARLDAEPWCELYIKSTDENIRAGSPRQARHERIGGNVEVDFRVLPWSEMGDLYRGADGFAFPSHGEGFGLTALEAMASGLPIVATRYGGVVDFLGLDGTTWTPHTLDRDEDMLFPGHAIRSAFADTGALGANLARVMRDHAEHVARARAGAARARRSWTWDAAGRAFYDTLREQPWPELFSRCGGVETITPEETNR